MCYFFTEFDEYNMYKDKVSTVTIKNHTQRFETNLILLLKFDFRNEDRSNKTWTDVRTLKKLKLQAKDKLNETKQ